MRGLPKRYSTVYIDGVKMYDPSSIAYYYYNNITGEYEWDEPDDYVEPPKHSHHLMMNPELKAALCIQGA